MVKHPDRMNWAWKWWIHDGFQVLGVFLFGMGLAAVVGRLNEIERWYNWLGPTDVGMAFPTGLACMMGGLAFYIVDHRLRRIEARIERECERKDGSG